MYISFQSIYGVTLVYERGKAPFSKYVNIYLYQHVPIMCPLLLVKYLELHALCSLIRNIIKKCVLHINLFICHPFTGFFSFFFCYGLFKAKQE